MNERIATRMTGNPGQWVVATIIISVVFRLYFAAASPISGDEALYWSYAQNLAPGFIDHPFLNPLMISLGTSIFGDTSIGVRIMSVLLSLPASWAVWRAAQIMTGDRCAAAMATIFFNLTLAVLCGSLVATSDMLVVTTTAFFLYSIAQLNATGNRAWWLAVGAALGIGMCAKYTTAFLVFGLLIHVVLSPGQRRLLWSPWLIVGILVSFLLFTPTLYWNYTNDWASFRYQGSRLEGDTLTFRYLLELIIGQILFFTPGIFYLSIRGLAGTRLKSGTAGILLALVMPVLLYFIWHSLYERVQGNWLMLITPIVAIAAGAGFFEILPLESIRSKLLLVSILVFGFGLFLLLGFQATTGFLPLGKKDPVARELAYGMRQVAGQLLEVVEETGADLVLTSDYTTQGWLRFHADDRLEVHQLNERIRWVDAPQPDSDSLDKGRFIYVCREHKCYADDFVEKYDRVELIREIRRMHHETAINTIRFFLLEGPQENVLDPVMPPMNSGGRNG